METATGPDKRPPRMATVVPGPRAVKGGGWVPAPGGLTDFMVAGERGADTES